MSASFSVRNSKVELNGVDISGVLNTVEVFVNAGVVMHLKETHSTGEVSTSVNQKLYIKEREADEFVKLFKEPHGNVYSFSRDSLRYTMKDATVGVSKRESIAGVVLFELMASSEGLPSRKYSPA